MPPSSLQLSVVLELLGRLWLREVDLETLRQLNQPGVRAAFEVLGGSVPTEIGPESVEQLAVDYCQLLIGPQDQLSPVQSIWESQQFQGAAAASMNRYFQMLEGYEPPSRIVDHLGVQLDFAGRLTLAVENESSGQRIAVQYAKDHLQWCNLLLERMMERAETDFYRGLARITQQVFALFDENS